MPSLIVGEHRRVRKQPGTGTGSPVRLLRMYHGPGLISMALAEWAEERGVELRFIERFNGSYRSGVLDMYVFRNLPEVRARAVRMVSEHQSDYPSECATIQAVSSKLGCTAETLCKWVRQAQRDAGEREGMSSSDRERMRELEREVLELRLANEILRKASAYFAQAELGRRRK